MSFYVGMVCPRDDVLEILRIGPNYIMKTKEYVDIERSHF